MPSVPDRGAPLPPPPPSLWQAGDAARKTGTCKTAARKTIAVVGTGGSIATIGRSPLDLVDYGDFGRLVPVESLFCRFPELDDLADFSFLDCEAVHSEAMDLPHWRRLAATVQRVAASVHGIVVVGGTSTLEEAAWFLHLTVAAPVPVVMVGAMRPANGLSSDAGINLASAVRAACDPGLAELGVVAVLDGDIHAARDVAKTSTYRVGSFTSGEFGPLGCVDAAGEVAIYRAPRRRGPVFDLDALGSGLPRVDVLFAHAGADGVAVEALANAGAAGLVVAAMAPGTCAPRQLAALEAAAARGVAVAFSSRAGHGRVLDSALLRQRGFIAADNLSPQKARILLALGLAAGYARDQLADLFHCY